MIQRILIGTVSLVVVLSACSDPAMTFPEYASAIQDVTDVYISEAQTLSVTFHGTVEAEVARIVEEGSDDARGEATDVTKREMVLYLALLEDAMGRYMERLAEVRPPIDVSAQHSDYVDAIESVRGAMPSTRSSVASALHLDGIEAAVAASGFQDGQFRLTKTCQSLEESVRAAGVGIDLGCTRVPRDDG
jgi:hypothetical protein